jgi:hypothetical protein
VESLVKINFEGNMFEINLKGEITMRSKVIPPKVPAYVLVMRCFNYAKKLEELHKMTDISISTLRHIVDGRGKYEGSVSTRLRLEAFLEKMRKSKK